MKQNKDSKNSQTQENTFVASRPLSDSELEELKRSTEECQEKIRKILKDKKIGK